MKSFIAVLAWMFIAIFANSDDLKTDHWKAWSSEIKAIYLAGWIDGLKSEHTSVTVISIQNSYNGKFLMEDPLVERFLQIVNKDLRESTSVPIPLLVSTIDALSSKPDYQNLSLRMIITSALNQIQGK